ncbi:unnamed protein product [Brachionus calyciflorus]|uniref:SWIM-type domain-containing protein n=1 Tax=Brachionus calyciflorus TaxID=104777 RepID=A0A814T1U4_9BILA|nr:unnamed protein product [Brachionus calyciflorus]
MVWLIKISIDLNIPNKMSLILKRLVVEYLLVLSCTCKSGRKVAGCCSHVAPVIYFLSYAKYHSMDFPAEYLYSVFVRIEECDSPNKPKYMKNKREKKVINEDSSASSDSYDLEDFEPEKDTKEDNLNESISSEKTDDGQHETMILVFYH